MKLGHKQPVGVELGRVSDIQPQSGLTARAPWACAFGSCASCRNRVQRAEKNETRAVGRGQLWPLDLTSEDSELVPQQRVFGNQVRLATLFVCEDTGIKERASPTWSIAWWRGSRG